MAVRYKPSAVGSTQLLNSPEMIAGIDAIVQGIAARANAMNHHGGEYVADTRPGRRRCHGMAKTGDIHAIVDNTYHNTLLKAMGGG
ncbi:MAG: hypothetical protein IJ092_03180 [Atopobiaceae bacterium]|nr:hypothetical protein [Atopobiaceae bacterium]